MNTNVHGVAGRIGYALAGGWRLDRDGRPGPMLRACLEAAVAAPSVHNSQPWRFRVRDDAVEVLADPGRQLDLVDPHGREMVISIGAAVLNLRVAMLAHGRVPIMQLLSAPTEPRLLARITFGATAQAPETARVLAHAIPLRRTNRRPFSDVPVPPEVLAELGEAARAEGAHLTPVGPELRDGIFDLVRVAETRRRNDPGYWIELARWTRDLPNRRDGVPPEAFGPWPVLDSVPVRDFGLVQTGHRRWVTPFEHASTVAVLSTSGDGRHEWLRAGQALQRVLLTATVRGVATTLMTQPLEFPELRDLLADRQAGRTVQAILRLGYGPPSPPTPRRPVDEVLVTTTPAHRG